MQTMPSQDFASQIGYALRAIFEYGCYALLGVAAFIFWVLT